METTHLRGIGTLETRFKVLKKHSQELRAEDPKKSIKARKQQLLNLEKWIQEHRSDLEAAVFTDLHKSAMEVSTTELFPVLSEIQHAVNNIEDWAKPKKVDAPLTFLGTRSEIRYEAKGTCLIISPWNYPFNLAIGPLVSCLAAGNTAIIKPSEHTPKTSAFIRRLIAEAFQNTEVEVFEGDAEVATELLKLPFDHIFYTGNPAIGKVVMKAAAENLTSVTLELGGKSPAIIDSSADLANTAKRIAFAKFVNNGQTCIAPDYIIIDNSVKEKFLALLKNSIVELFGRGNKVDRNSNDYSRIVNEKQFDRIDNLVNDAINKGATPYITGEFSRASKFISPTILTNVTEEMLVMQEEIFGPVLPIIGVDKISESIAIITAKPKPLALYIFSNRSSFREEVLRETSAGGVCINDCVLQFAHPNLPFGGVNNSGIGKAHGHAGFLAFSNEKPVVKQLLGYSMAYAFYPPYTPVKRRLIDVILRWFA